MLIKIFPVEKIREADQYTIDHEPISSINLMERAAYECYLWLLQKAQVGQEFAVFCGLGNNGGDGLAISRMLAKAGFSVSVFIVNLNDRFSSDFQKNLQRLEKYPVVTVKEWKEKPDEFPVFSHQTILVDALFGSGLSKPLRGLTQKLVQHVNQQPNIKVSIDIPSGLFSDQYTDIQKTDIFRADYTLSFQFPKLAFLMSENEVLVGEWNILNIDLSYDYIQQTDCDHYFITHPFISSLIRPRKKFSHKGSFGHVLMIAGDHSKMGAAILSSKSALRVGAGLVTLHHPSSAKTMVPIAVPEVMSSIDEDELAFTKVPDLAKFSHVAIGPGLGERPKTATALKVLIQQVETPMVFDADALNILAKNPTWLNFLPKSSILTPHVGEFTRLTGNSKNSFERLQKAKDFAVKYQIYLVLKGANSIIATPTGKVYFNSSGNSGMATGGSGDVLTGIIIGLLAQNYTPLEACLIGVYLHGLSGDIAIENMAAESLIASDIINNIGIAFHSLYL